MSQDPIEPSQPLSNDSPVTASQLNSIYHELDEAGEAEWEAMKQRVSDSTDPCEGSKKRLLDIIKDRDIMLAETLEFHCFNRVSTGSTHTMTSMRFRRGLVHPQWASTPKKTFDGHGLVFHPKGK